MFRKIVVAYDESPEAERAIRSAIYLSKVLAAELLTVTVAEELPAYTGYAAAIWSTVYSLAQDAPCSVLGVH
jgi:nucleotide-binding universal stress UspA family protein